MQLIQPHANEDACFFGQLKLWKWPKRKQWVQTHRKWFDAKFEWFRLLMTAFERTTTYNTINYE